jgi:hypothetical protein
MELDLARQRQEAHWLIDVLPEDKLHAVRTLLKVLVEPPPLAESLASAPDEEEELTPETIASIELGRLQGERGEVTSHEEMLREFAS